MEATNQTATENLSNAPAASQATEQKDAVFALASNALANVARAEGQPLRALVTKEVRKAIRVGLFEGIKNGSIKYSKQNKTDGQLKKYCSSLINNWLKKDPRFN